MKSWVRSPVASKSVTLNSQSFLTMHVSVLDEPLVLERTSYVTSAPDTEMCLWLRNVFLLVVFSGSHSDEQTLAGLY